MSRGQAPIAPHFLASLQIHCLRNLSSVTLELGPAGNFFFGENGAGKTSILEAVHFLSTGRSFRQAKAKSLITHEQEWVRVTGHVVSNTVPVPLGIQRNRQGGMTARVAGSDAQSLSELAAKLPIVLLDVETTALLSGPPEGRRRLLDGTVFHVEQSFMPLWRRYQRALRQRNAALRRGIIEADDAWREELQQTGEQLTEKRQAVLTRLDAATRRIATEMSSQLAGVELTLRRGWERHLPLSDALYRSRDSDRRQGFSQVGPHRADVRVTIAGRPAADVLSRGQSKVLVAALRLAQGEEVAVAGDRRPIYLIDDLFAELDQCHARRVSERLALTGSQVLMTAVEPGLLMQWWGGAPAKVFHVEQGRAEPA